MWIIFSYNIGLKMLEYSFFKKKLKKEGIFLNTPNPDL